VIRFITVAGAAASTTSEPDPWASFWPSFLGGTAGAGVTGIITLLVYFLTSAAGARRAREESLKHFLELTTQLAENSLAGTPDAGLLFRTNDALARLTLTARAPRKPVYNWAMNRVMAIFAFDNMVTVSSARTALTAQLHRWARHPWSWKIRRQMIKKANPSTVGAPTIKMTWIDGTTPES
jgi:hypothetical protein